jgi:spore coat polysaccharide biosynthesis predicted glycosyltransferase SpsG
MSKIEHILHKAHKKGIFEETMSLAQDIKVENPKLEVADRYELAYERAKQTRIKSFPPINN